MERETIPELLLLVIMFALDFLTLWVLYSRILVVLFGFPELSTWGVLAASTAVKYFRGSILSDEITTMGRISRSVAYLLVGWILIILM